MQISQTDNQVELWSQMLAAAHGMDEACPTLITLREIKQGMLNPVQLKRLREEGVVDRVPGNGESQLRVTLTTDAESVYKSLSSRDLKVPTERTMLGHASWLRELLFTNIISAVQWCDTRDMTADGHTKGSIERELLLKVMSGSQSFSHDIQSHTPFRGQKEPNYDAVNCIIAFIRSQNENEANTTWLNDFNQARS